jgi:hypothetical protein
LLLAVGRQLLSFVHNCSKHLNCLYDPIFI